MMFEDRADAAHQLAASPQLTQYKDDPKSQYATLIAVFTGASLVALSLSPSQQPLPSL